MRKQTLIAIIIIAFIALLSCRNDNTESSSTIKLATWNIRILSDGSREDYELEQIANIIQQYDLVAIQETRDVTVLNRLKAFLPGYDFLVSFPIGTEDAKELYAYYYKTAVVSTSGTPYLYDDTNDDFIREPYIACFKANNFDFILITIHVLYGTEVERREEIKLLDDVLRQVQNDNAGENDIMLLGDFNFDRTDLGWQITTHDAVVAPTTKTMISDANSFDNIWIDSDSTGEYKKFLEVYSFDEILYNNDDDTASLEVSDHRPVAVIINIDKPDDDTGSGCPGEPPPEPDVSIYSVTASPTDAEQVTLKNHSAFAGDISYWTIGDLNDSTAYSIPAGTVLNSNATIMFDHNTFGFTINNSGETIYLKNYYEETIDTWSN